jgi:hypothetical protein
VGLFKLHGVLVRQVSRYYLVLVLVVVLVALMWGASMGLFASSTWVGDD